MSNNINTNSQEFKDLMKTYLEYAVKDIYKDFGIIAKGKSDKLVIAQAIVYSLLNDLSYDNVYNNTIYPYIKNKYNLPKVMAY